MSENEEVVNLSELNWEINFDTFSNSICSNEKLLLILNKESGLAPYSHEFIEGAQDPQVLAGFISAISSFMGEATGKSQSQWKTVFGSDSVILVEGGEWSIGVLAAAKETSEARSKLRSVLHEFEECFEYLRDVEGIQNIFSDFNQYVRRVFVDERVSNRTVVTKNPEWRDSISNLELPSAAFEVSKVLLGFEENATVQEISEYQNIKLEKVIETVSLAFWHGIVSLKYVPSDEEILALSDKASTILFGRSNPLKLQTSSIGVISCFDGRSPLSHFTGEMMVQDRELLLQDLGNLINNGLVQRISVEKRLVLFNESILSHLVSQGASIVGTRSMNQDFKEIQVQGRNIHPWISRISLQENMSARCTLQENMTHIDLDDMYDAVEYFIDEILKHLAKRCGKLVTNRLLKKVRTQCHQKWAPYLSNVVI